MWSAITRIFSKNSSIKDGLESPMEMDHGDQRRNVDEKFNSRQGKQRATVKWLLSKAFNNKVPDNLKEPFYRDHENQEHLKPQIVGGLANAELYCMSLGNIYSDPNYHNLNHWAILQTLSRKGVFPCDSSDSQLTETTLIQTNPLRIQAHMTVIESIMALYAKEVATPDRVMAAIQRFNHGRITSQIPRVPDNPEQGLVLWIAQACDALVRKIEQDNSANVMTINGGDGERSRIPNFPPIRELKDLCDGVGLAALVSYYCPDGLAWNELKVSYAPTVHESLYNVTLVQHFCTRCLPGQIFHLAPEDVTYMRDSMKINVIVFLADLFNMLEIQTPDCVRYSEKMNVSRSEPPQLPLRKTNSVQSVQRSIVSHMSEDSLLRRSSEDSAASTFVVHRGRNVPTLSSVIGDEPLIPARLRANKENLNNDSKADERGERPTTAPAGRPSNWHDSRSNPTFAGRRSRRNSTSDDSQLTIENFGGSQDNLNFIGRNPDKEVAVHVGRKLSATENPIAVAVRSTLQDAKGSIQLGYDEDEKQDNETEKLSKFRRSLVDDVEKKKEKLIQDLVDGDTSNRTSFADVKRESSGIQLVYMQQQEKEKETERTNERKTSFATLPTNQTTTWQQQQRLTNNEQYPEDSNGSGSVIGENGMTNNGGNMTAQLNDIRMKLEEKRRHIENEKRRMEVAMSKHRQKVGKAAFLQAITKGGKGNFVKSPENDSITKSEPNGEDELMTTQTTTRRLPVQENVSVKPERPFNLQDVTDDVSSAERKWLDNERPYVETKRTPELENMNMEQYQQSIAQIDSSLHDIHTDIQRLTSQQNQIQAVQQQNLMTQQVLQQQHHQQYLAQNQQQFNNPHVYQVYPSPLQQSSSVPHMFTPQSHFFLHDHQQQQPQPVASQRRTWGQPPPIENSWSRSTATPQSGGFILHDNIPPNRYQNGEGRVVPGMVHHSNSFTLSQQHLHQQNASSNTSHSTPTASPQHRVHKLISQLMDDATKRPSLVTLQQMGISPSPQTHLQQQQQQQQQLQQHQHLQQQQQKQRKISVTHAPIPAPSADDMEPQNISFIGNSDDQLIESGIGRLNITSGTRTYRIPSPTRPSLNRNSFTPTTITPTVARESLSTDVDDSTSQKGFYISFDDEQPKRPKPPLRTKRGSPKKERSFVDDNVHHQPSQRDAEIKSRAVEKSQEDLVRRNEEEDDDRKSRLQAEKMRQTSQRVHAAAAIIIGNELQNPDPDLQDEREKKKERIMLLSLQRRQQQEEAKARKEEEARMRKEMEKEKEDEKARKKEEQAMRRAVILEQYKLKKAIEEAEREGKVIDKSELMSTLKPAPKMRPKASATRPRPKTIHIDSGSVEMAGSIPQSVGKKGSTSNLTGNSFSTQSTMKRDYYRGSQDSLADRSLSSGVLYRDSPDDSRGMSPCHSANQTLGRRSSYKTSRDPSPAQARGRSKFSTLQNFKGRKSSSLMNLYGSSSDQDSFAYRYGETDSGLGRATPPRRAPSPGMGSLRHLPSPSGPGSLPGLMSKGRRMFDDGSSDISSTPSSMMDYTGPRLYKQPATKSNRGIMLNAVEYCVFPGVVNREAKRRVIEEINRSESKHFLILFRDAGCQFRALYSYCPDREEVAKLYGTGPKQVNDRMFDKFFKYNSGGKCFSQVHTKHLTVTIDAFTIHNSLWQGKKVNLPSKKDMALVI